jgi:4-methyl-5(b-hydroxyethyl)-thiazole monophosphate biosynthesis
MYKTLVLLAAGFEEIEAVTVIDLLRRSEIDVAVAGLGSKKVIGSHGIPVYCDILINDIRPNEYDVLCLPGGQPGSYPSERNIFSQSEYQNKNVVEDNNIITSRGVGTAIDFALTLVKILRGAVHRDQLAERILWIKDDKTI